MILDRNNQPSPFPSLAAQLIENQLDQLHMLGLDDSDRETIPDCEIYPHMMGELSDQVMMRTMPADASQVFDDDGYEGR